MLNGLVLLEARKERVLLFEWKSKSLYSALFDPQLTVRQGLYLLVNHRLDAWTAPLSLLLSWHDSLDEHDEHRQVAFLSMPMFSSLRFATILQWPWINITNETALYPTNIVQVPFDKIREIIPSSFLLFSDLPKTVSRYISHIFQQFYICLIFLSPDIFPSYVGKTRVKIETFVFPQETPQGIIIYVYSAALRRQVLREPDLSRSMERNESTGESIEPRLLISSNVRNRAVR